MLTLADEINREMADVKAVIEAVDRDIEGRERRLASLRTYRDQKCRRLLILEGQLAREEAPHVKPTGKYVVEKMPDGTHWTV